MAVEARPRPWQQAEQELALPPLYAAVRLRELGDAFAHAMKIAAESGAGTLVHVGRFDVVEFALVLEPEEPLRAARRAFYAGMTALSDALIGAAEPETTVEIVWPDAIRVNSGLVGGGRLGWPQGVGEDDVPPWLVFGAMVRMQPPPGWEPGLNPDVTSLSEEGFGGLAEEGGGGIVAQRIIEGFARHFMVALDSWQESGFAAVARIYLERLAREKGLRRDIADNGDLLTRRMVGEEVERKSLVDALAAPSWLDPATGAPRA